MEGHYQKLSQFAVLVKSLFPAATTTHSPTECIDKETIYQKDMQYLYEMLVHSITLVNKLYRLQDNDGSYISEREDYATALMLMSPLFSVNSMDLPPSIRIYYQQISVEIGYCKSFTWKDLQRICKKSKTRCNNILQQLLALHLIKLSGKGYRHIYQYELLPVDGQTIDKNQIWEDVAKEWEGFKQWVEF